MRREKLVPEPPSMEKMDFMTTEDEWKPGPAEERRSNEGWAGHLGSFCTFIKVR